MATEKFTINSKDLVDKIKQLIHGGKTVLEIPLTIGASAAALTIMMAPVLAAVGAFAALVTECTIEVEKVDDKKPAR